MKNNLKTIIAVTSFFIGLSVFAQAPQKFSYQAVIRNSSNQLIINQQVAVRISILQGSESGNVVFSEIHSPSTNSNGLITIQVGSGTIISGNIDVINWANGPYFIQTETDPTGGNDYTLTTTSQMLSVPYALYAENSGSSIPGPQGLQGPSGPQGPQGEQGPIGLTGTTGPQGPIGLTGSQGPQGIQGEQGPVGPQGPIGLTGAIGPQGPQGQTGATGPQGPAGQNGAMGPQGPQGDPATDDQQLSVSETGDTLFLQGGGFVIVQGISFLNSGNNMVEDQGGNEYEVVKIGSQIWMKENLNTEVFCNGDTIPNITNTQLWPSLTSPAWAYYAQSSANEMYGKLYNFYTVIDERNVCPCGWRVPSADDWMVLINSVGGRYVGAGKLRTTGTIETGTGLWVSPNFLATNESGFSALPAGSLVNSTSFQGLGAGTYFWSNTYVNNINQGQIFNLILDSNNSDLVGSFNADPFSGFSIRCIKN